MIALTATANGIYRVKIKHSLIIKNPVEVIASPNRINIFYSKLTSYENILRPIAERLMDLKVEHPLTII